MNKSKITTALLLALASTGAAASDRIDVNALGGKVQNDVSLSGSQSQTTTWMVKANASTAVSVADVTRGAASTSSVDAQHAVAQANDGLDRLEAAINALGADVTIISRTTKLAASLVLQGEKSEVMKVRQLAGVASVLPVYDSELHIADSAEYINATQLVESGSATGAGISVAVLDSGIDYTHAAMGGPGTAEAYAEAAADTADTPAWPIGNVKGGYDFVFNDPDPLDNGVHGTHVAHSVLGVAPEADIYGYTVCQQTCSGAAQLGGLEAAMDPNGDGDISDRVDIINMSLGGDYGTSRGGAVADMINRAVDLGVVVAISAGNDGPYPFIVGGPSTTDNALSVGAMTHPTTALPVVSGTFAGEEIAAVAAAFNADAEFSLDGSLPVVYAESETNATGCDPYAADLTGQAVLIDRGACAFTQKIQNAQAAGAEFVIVANNNPGEAPFVMGGTPTEEITINAVMVSFESGAAMKEALVGGALDYSFSSELIVQEGAIADFTSRGPSLDGRLKPEITAPGVQINTALSGTGDQLSPINGTSFSSPMTAGAMALLAEVFPRRNAFELKATLMNTANLNVTMEPRSLNPETEMAPISYIGAGLVDVEKASMSQVAAWDMDTKQGALSFGPLPLSSTTSVTKTIMVKNFSTEDKTYNLSDEARFANDMETGALTMDYPGSVTVPAGQTMTFEVTATFDPTLLPEWALNSGNIYTEAGTEGLTTVEYDGALMFTESGADEPSMHMVYHSLPKGFAEVELSSEVTDDGIMRMVTNTGVVPMDTATIPLTVDSGVDEDKTFDIISAGIETYPSSACATGGIVLTTITMRDPVLIAHQAGFFMDVDVNSDGQFDFTAQTINYGAFGQSTFESMTFTRPFGSLSGSLFFTQHEPGSNQLTMVSCAEDLGLTASDLETGVPATVAFRVENSSFDFDPTQPYDADLVAMHDFTFTGALPSVVDADGAPVDMLAPGETAYLQGAAAGGFTFFSNGGVVPSSVASASNGSAPTVASQSFSVDENAENGTVIGTIEASDSDVITSPVSEIYVQSSSSIAVDVSSDGVITVANSEMLDYDAGLESIMLEVVAIDTQGNTSETVEVEITVNNLADEASEQPQPAPEPSSDSAGSMSWIALLLLPVAILRRRIKK
ncbi:S8 family serine peptidase [Alteromonas halophila]|uniref:Serine protease n=1 Tax=Alteromonas halophila TaxID=516698 RepID=A0A918N037_9ALTE|nr:S8 family serine peptidase [Alteromonas halophila]GGW88420.1 serine protease [Alteromonas halophila]